MAASTPPVPLPVDVPAGWRVASVDRALGFVTRVRWVRPDGSAATWESRDHRKGLSRARERLHAGPVWRPRARAWWIAVLFMVGSALFALGSVSSYAQAVGPRADAVTYFVGSVFFTSASYLAFVESVSAGRDAAGARGRTRWFGFQPRRIDWWATIVQLVGTVAFNISTFAACVTALEPDQVERFVWVPDWRGSVCFLVSSLLAWFEVSHGPWSWRPRLTSWWIVVLNLLGSVAFQVSAFAAVLIPGTTAETDPTRAVRATLVGALCFLVGAYLLLPEQRDAAAPDPATSHV